MLSAALNVQAL